MAIALSPDEQAQLLALAQDRGYMPGGPMPAGPPAPPMPAPMIAPSVVAPRPSPLDQALMQAQSPGAPPAPTPPIPSLNPSIAHTKPPGWSDPTHALAPDQTVGYQGGAGLGAPGAMPVQPPPMLTTSSSSTSTQKGIHLSPETLAAQRAMGEAGAREAALRAEGQQATQSARVAGMTGQIDQMQAGADAANARAQEHEAQLAAKRAHIASMMSTVEKEQVDPDRWWANRSTGQKIGAAIALMAGGFKGGWTRSPNEAAKMVREAVDADISAQRANIEAKHKAVQGQTMLYDMTKGAFHDDEERAAAARAAGFAIAQKKADLQLAEASDPLERAKIEEFKRDLAKTQVEVGSHLDQLTADKTTVSSHSTTSPNPAAAAGAVPSDRIVRLADGRLALAGNPADAKSLQNSARSLARIKQLDAQIRALQDKGGNSILGLLSDDRAALETKQAEMKRELMTFGEHLGRGKEASALASDAMGDPSSIFDFHSGARLDAVVQGAQNDYNAALQSANVVPLADSTQFATQGGKVVATGTGLQALPTRGGARR